MSSPLDRHPAKNHDQNQKQPPKKQSLAEGLDDEEVLQIIEEVACAKRFQQLTFAYYTYEDIKQEARLMCLDALQRWDKVRSLKAFLLAHVHNRLHNLKRDKFHRNDSPCRICAEGRPCGGGDKPDLFCGPFLEWRERNSVKAAIACPDSFFREEEVGPSPVDVPALAASHDIVEKVDRELPVELRSYYLQMRAGLTVPKFRRQQVERAVREILGDYYSTDPDGPAEHL